MTDVVLVAIVGAIPGVISSLLGYFNHKNIQAANGHIADTKAQVVEAKADIVEVGKQINGRMNEQIEMTKQISYAAGVTQEKEDEQGKKDVAARKTKPKPRPSQGDK